MSADNVYRFGPSGADGDASMKDLLGGKGANLAEMAKLGLPVPHGVTIPTTACIEYLAGADDDFVYKLVEEVDSVLAYEYPGDYLYSVRSGARVSMPGMMDTILNVGLNDETVIDWADKIGERAAWDSYRRLIQMHGEVAYGIPASRFENDLRAVKSDWGVSEDTDLNVTALRDLVTRYKDTFKSATNVSFPQTLKGQLFGAVTAVFRSWNNDRAKHYRKMHGYPDDWGTAVNIQSMVFGNTGDKSCSGVMFTRNPSTGVDGVFGEYLINAQGEDVVAGIRTPLDIHKKVESGTWNPVHHKLMHIASKLETHYRDMQDIEFTVQDGEVFILQTRNGKRTPKAAFRIAHDLFESEVIQFSELADRVPVEAFFKMQTPEVVTASKPTGHGLPAGGFPVKGTVVFSSSAAVAFGSNSPVILVRPETTPDDIAGMEAAVGILTATGGMTSHAAVVARGMNKPCVVGLTDLDLSETGIASLNGVSIAEGAEIVIDGSTGNVWMGDLPEISEGKLDEYTSKVMALLMKGKTVITNDPNDAVFGRVIVPVALTEREHIAEILSVKGGSDVVLDMSPIDKLFADRGVTIDPIQHLFSMNLEGINDLHEKLDGLDLTGVYAINCGTGVTTKLKALGASVPKTASTIHQLLKADGPVIPSADLMKAIGTKTALNKLIKEFNIEQPSEVSGVSPSVALGISA